MTGITKEELYDFIEHNRDVEFEIENVEYCIILDIINDIEYLTVSRCVSKDEDKYEYIYKLDMTDKIMNKELITNFLNEKIYDGKSFNDLYRKIKVTRIL